MYISPISATNKSVCYRNNSAKKAEKIQNNPTFKKAEYAKAFAKYFDGPAAPNEQIFKELMAKAQNIKDANIQDVCKLFFRPQDYNRAMVGSRKREPVYDTINTHCYKTPYWLVKADDSILVTVFDMGFQGGLLDLLTFNIHNDLRICFHDINNYKNVLCLKRDNDDNDICIKTKGGVAEIIRCESIF